MKDYQQYEAAEIDELQAKFTGWLDIVVYRAKLKYIKKQENQPETISIEDISESHLAVQDASSWSSSPKTAFDFEEERLANAFAKLPLKRQQILTMLFVEEKKPEEIAHLLNCSPQHVYDQRYQALKKLRLDLTEGGDKV